MAKKPPKKERALVAGREIVLKELDRIRQTYGGILHPSAIVESARSELSPLHSKFTWDDSVAAAEHRLWQARELIRVCVTMVENSDGKMVQIPTFHSLGSDRINGGGYRHVIDVLSNNENRNELLAQALRELDFLRRKYNSLSELSNVFEAVEIVKRKVG